MPEVVDASYLLNRWAKWVNARPGGLGFASLTPIMRALMGRPERVVSSPSYFPDREAERVNRVIEVMPEKYRGPLVCHYLLRTNQAHGARLCQMCASSYRRRLEAGQRRLAREVG